MLCFQFAHIALGGLGLFACLQVYSRRPSGLAGRLIHLLKKPETRLEYAHALGADFGVVHAENKGRGPDWEAVSRLLRPQIRCLIAPEEWPVPQELELEADVGDFERRMLLLAACRLADRTRMPLYRRVLGLYDPPGILAEELLTLLRYFSSVRVVTQNLERYEEMATLALEELGAPVMLGSDPSDFSDCILLLCPQAVKRPLALLPSCPVLAGGFFADEGGCNLLSSPQAALGRHRSCVPPGIAPHAFAAVFFCCENSFLPEEVESLLLNGKRSGLDEAARLILREAGYAYPLCPPPQKGE